MLSNSRGPQILTDLVAELNCHPPRDGQIAELDAGTTTSSERLLREGRRLQPAEPAVLVRLDSDGLRDELAKGSAGLR